MYKQRHRPANLRKTPKCNYAHIGYIATRSGASKNEGMRHGLFGKLEPGSLVEFGTWQEVGRIVRELSYRKVNLYRGIVSFSPETAAELGLTDHQSWQDYVERHVQTMAAKNGIRPQDLGWAAAHHAERSHPHCHIVFWDKHQRMAVPFVKPAIPNQIRIQLIKDTFAEQIAAWQQEKDRLRGQIGTVTDDLVAEFDEYVKASRPQEYKRMKDLFSRIDDGEIGASSLEDVTGRMDLKPLIGRLFSLMEHMPKKGRLYYKLLPEDGKQELDALVTALKENCVYIRDLVKDYADSKVRLAELYESNPETLYDRYAAAIDEADKLIANRILRVIKSMLTKDGELAFYEYTEAQKAYYTEKMVSEILMMLEQAVVSLEEDATDRCGLMDRELSKAAKKEWAILHRDRGMEL